VAATPCAAGAWTGYGAGDWYYPLQHGASSVWSGFACMYREGDARANPLAPLPGPVPVPINPPWGLLRLSLLMVAAGILSLIVAHRRTGAGS
jgi:hypothetical protein